MLYQHLSEHCFNEQTGVAQSQVNMLLAQNLPAFKALVSRENAQAAPLLDLPQRTADLDGIETLAKELRTRFRNIVVAGTGGSGLSGRTLTQMKLSGASMIHFLENIDPDTMDDLLAHLDVENTCFLIISKSGGTAETLSQYYVLFDHVVAKLGKNAVRERFIIITMRTNNPLRRAAAEHGLRVLDHDHDIGGRFAILTVVGLLPAAIAGLDIRALRRGAQSVVAQMESCASPAACPPAFGAALQYAFVEAGYPMSVMLPYSERLSGFSSWYRQNWAESLGKGGKGSTPIRAVGTTDQHSQLQLYLDGPRDKLFHMILLDRAGKGAVIRAPEGAELDYLRGKTMGDVMAAEQKATFETLVLNHRPVRVFKLDVLGEEQMGALLMHFMLEIILTAGLFNVNPFDQPAVEDGKKLTCDYLLTGKL
jgi:glucose-6-phosphate isomerase